MLKWLLENVPILNQHDVLNLVAKVSKETPMYEIVDDSHSYVCVFATNIGSLLFP